MKAMWTYGDVWASSKLLGVFYGELGSIIPKDTITPAWEMGRKKAIWIFMHWHKGYTIDMLLNLHLVHSHSQQPAGILATWSLLPLFNLTPPHCRLGLGCLPELISFVTGVIDSDPEKQPPNSLNEH